MRPLRLELDGFTSFREPTTIDFEGADFFALVGPTGSGKSSIIDAMCFALYGSVFRLEDRRKVAPVISQGKLEAKVRFDFTVGDDTYTAVRVVRRSGSGGTTKEARLERDDETLAGNADELTRAVTEMLGLTFDHFTRCVVLPQGEFARFLHDKPKDRQELLVELLNLGVYERMMQAANVRAARLKTQMAVARQRLDEELAWATPAALDEAKERVERLNRLRLEVEAAVPLLTERSQAAAAAQERERAAREWLVRIDSLATPPAVAGLAKDITAAQQRGKDLKRKVDEARAEVKRLSEACKELPTSATLSTTLKTYEQRSALAARSAEAAATVLALEGDESAARKALEDALSAATAASEAVNEIHNAEQAWHLAQHLDVGKPCPVCRQNVATLPEHAMPKGLAAAERKLDQAEAAVAKRQGEVERIVAALTTASGKLETLREQLAELERDLAQAPPETEARAALEQVRSLETELEAARGTEAAARDAHDEAVEALEELKHEEAAARDEFEAARDLFAPLGPPPAARLDIAADWKSLVKWATEQRAALSKAAALAGKEAAVAIAARDASIDALRSSCTGCAVEVTGDDFVTPVVTAHTEAKGAVKDLERVMAEADKLNHQIAAAQTEHDVAHALAQHLSAKPGFFENWIVNEALRGLVAGASRILHELSNDQYALTIDQAGNFLVTDRHNANETRSARTLSGGETFLASLALALSLADQIAELASEGAARLDAIFLDEGFGTLDPETLDTVAATVENLSASGRMVGIVTHVRELADRVPLQFRVRKDARTSTVERVEAA